MRRVEKWGDSVIGNRVSKNGRNRVTGFMNSPYDVRNLINKMAIIMYINEQTSNMI